MTSKACVSMCVLGFVLCGCEAGVDDEFSDDELGDFRSGVGLDHMPTTPRLNTPELNDSCGYFFPAQCTADIETDDGAISPSVFECGIWLIPKIFEYSFLVTKEDGNTPLYSIDREQVFPKSDKSTKESAFSECERFVVHKGLSLSDDGNVSQSDRLHVACAESASGKAARWGHVPWADELGLERYEAAIRVIRADYCATGIAHTEEGKAIYFLDNPDLDPNTVRGFMSRGEYPLEAVWGLDGAICIESRRINESQELECGEKPTCSELGGLAAILASEEYDVFAVTRLPSLPCNRVVCTND